MTSVLPPGDAPWTSSNPARSTLLVVDDQRINLELINEMFQADHEVCIATSGAEALEFCESRLPDLILLDVVMPDMDGHEVCRRLKQNPITRDIPVIFITARDNLVDEVQGLEEGAVDFIGKPLVPALVRARVRAHLTLKQQSDFLHSLAFIDGLTGIGNRRNFDETLSAEWRRCVRTSQPLSLIMLDLDYFKLYNDHYGHQVGDQCLKTVAAALKQCFSRSHDLVARYGGEEFACVLPDTPLEGAEKKARELQQVVQALALPHAASAAAPIVTMSIGVAVAMPARGESPSSLIAAADGLLYAAKQAGRNTIKAARY
ncbi:MAG TPA: diguanylate cyclase [Rhodocyclaceae bacterium]|jgi:diguanylate cyclase (GGDEF)-like protein|nr:diguanylate cyclase [Rhodocyclaceae bacterium]